MIEDFSAVREFPGYYVNRSGQVASMRTGKFTLKLTHKSSNGYAGVSLCVEGQEKTKSVHRLVASTFLPNPLGKRTVNHKNGSKMDNRVENLEWSTHSENTLHAIQVLGRKIGPKRKWDEEKAIRLFQTDLTQQEIAEKLGIDQTYVSRLRRRYPHLDV